MHIIAGLGNPGKKYQNTWHNIGFMAVDHFLKKHNFSDFAFSKKFNASVSEADFENEKVMLVKPYIYMNESGKPIASIANFYKTEPERLIVVHDDMDLLLGKIKISAGKGSAGHKGVESIFTNLGSQKFIRIRIGINPNPKEEMKAEEIVLKEIEENQNATLKKIVKKAGEALECLIKNGLEKTMSQYNN